MKKSGKILYMEVYRWENHGTKLEIRKVGYMDTGVPCSWTQIMSRIGHMQPFAGQTHVVQYAFTV
jgi:hypothetical protein